MISLAPGASHSLTIDPHPLFVPSGLVVTPGERYHFLAEGLWRDWCKTVDADGWSAPLLHYLNRLPGAAFFCLCGCLDHDEGTAFAIGRELLWQVPAEASAGRELQLFANDWRCMYFNNRALPAAEGGPLTLGITRLD